jgi:nicotinamidase/pyrazinamidase
MTRALLLIDLQHDFLPGGALAVPRGDETLPVAARLLAELPVALRVATQDRHPADHGSFASQHPGRRPYDLGELSGLPQVLWPDHCVEGTRGAALADAVDPQRVDRVFPKGTDRRVDSYSGFFDNDHRSATGLDDYLRQRGITQLVMLGLATDYCVKATALDARALGYEVTLAVDGCRAVDVTPGDGERALAELRDAGVRLTTSAALLAAP